MAKIPGLNISAPVVPAQDSDAYPSHRAIYGHGGWREVTSTTERDAISQARREAGMAVYVTSEKSVYILNDDLVTWTLLEQGKVDDVQIKTSTDGNFETVVADKIAKIDLSNINASIDTIEGLIPTQASTTNQLADKDFVNSSISSNTAVFIGTFQSLEELNSYQGTLTDNDYAFVVTKDENNDTTYERYKYTINDGTGEWKFEYTLNNSSFTAEQWAAINSNATPDLIAQISNNKTNIENHIADTSNPHAVTKAQVGLENVDNTSDIDKPISTATQAALDLKANASDLSSHVGDKSNPHEVTKDQVGLGNVDNTSDADKPISTATQAALDQITTDLGNHIDDKENPHAVTKAQVGLDNVDNTSDLDKPISTATQAALNDKADKSDTYTKTEVDAKVSSVYRFKGTVAAETSLPTSDNITGDVYNVEDTGANYAWDGTAWDKLSETVDLTSYLTKEDAIKTYETIENANLHKNNTSNPHNVTKAQVGLGNVDNTSDANKPVSTATQTALDKKQDTLTAGTNITITGTTISAKDTTYTAGDGIKIENGIISNTRVSAEWGNVTGDITAQEDLQSALNLKADKSDTYTKSEVDGAIKTVNDKVQKNTEDIATLNTNKANTSDLTSHVGDKSNPHEVTKAQVGLGNVDNTADLDKPISTATQEALDQVVEDYKAADTSIQASVSNNKTSIDNHIDNKSNPHSVTKAQVGLGNVDNTADLDKPVSTATQAALDLKANQSTTYTKEEVDDLLEPKLDSSVAADTYATITNLNAHTSNVSNPHKVTKAQVGLDNVDNTSDLNKPISTATQEALDTIIENYEKADDELNSLITANKTSADNHIANKSNPHSVTKAQVGLGNVDNTSDKDKPISDATQAALDKLDEDYKAADSTINSSITTINETLETVGDTLDGHIANKSNPHSVTKAQVGLGNVDNTSDLNKPISTAMQEALDDISTDLSNHINDVENPHAVTKDQVGLGNVDNTSDLNKPISTATQAALDLKANTADVYNKESVYNKEEVDDLLEPKLDSTTASSTYATITSLNSHVNDKSNPHSVTKAQVGLGNVDNTSDANKPVSAAQQAALNLKADKSTTYSKTEVDDLLAPKLDTETAEDTYATITDLSSHTSNTSNPHQVTAEQIGLGNVDNTSDLDKPISTATQTALNAKADQSNTYTKQEVDNLIAGDGVAYNGAVTTILDDNLFPGRVVVSDSNGKVGISGISSTELGTLSGISSNIQNQIDAKADASTTYSKTDVDDLLDAKADASTTYSKTDVDDLLDAKADASTTYSKTDVDTSLGTKVDKVSTANKVYGTNASGAQTTYDVNSFGAVDDVQVDGTSVVSDKIASLGSMAGEDASDYSTKAVADTLYAAKSLETTVSSHINNTSNPHSVTKAQVGLGNVDNTSDADKPISTATQTALDLKADKSTTYTKTQVDDALDLKLDKTEASSTYATITNLNVHTTNKSNPHSVTKAQVGLGNVDNTSDLNKPISTATQTALNLKANVSDVYTKSEVDAKVSGLYKFKGSVETEADLPKSGNITGDTYNITSTGANYTWDGSNWDKLSETIDLSPYLTIASAQSTYATAANVKIHTDNTSNPHKVTKAQVGLGNVDNTSDANKPISTATQAALDLKANQSTTYTKTDTDVLLNKKLDVDTASTTYAVKSTETTVNNHISNKSNPHSVTKAQVGLGNVDNTSDSSKPVSTLQQAALDLKADKTTTYTKTEVDEKIEAVDDKAEKNSEDIVAQGKLITNLESNKASASDLTAHTSNTSNPHNVTAAQVGLGNVDNTSDADKPISTATQSALDEKQDTLTAGTNITITGTTISAKDTTYTAGDGISITDGVISNTRVSAEWGNVTGDITAQEDLQNALALKANQSTTYTKTEVDNKVEAVDDKVANNTQEIATIKNSKADSSVLSSHTSNTSNPHEVTAEQIGLGNVDNTSDADKPISTATQTALDLKADKSTTYTKSQTDAAIKVVSDKVTTNTASITSLNQSVEALQDSKADATDLSSHTSNVSNPHNVTAEQVGLGNVDNTSDADKPISTATQTALNAKADKNSTYTKAEVDAKVSSVYRFIGSVASVDKLPATATVGDTYNVEDTGANYAWTGTAWDKLSETIDLTPYLTKSEASTTYETIENVGLHTNNKNNPHSVTKAQVGLGNVDNTSDLAKPISTATQNALNDKADKSTTYTKTEVDGKIKAVSDKVDKNTEDIATHDESITTLESSKANASDLTSHTSNVSNPHKVTKAQVGLGNVDNTSDADKPISTATQAALDLKANITDIIKEVQNISSTNVYNSIDDLPELDASKNGTRYLALTNGSLPLVIYSWTYNTKTWDKIDQCRGSTVYTNIETGKVYYYRSSAPYLRQFVSASEWGSITGTLSNQTDLNTALENKADKSTTYTKSEVDGAIKTVNDKVQKNTEDIATLNTNKANTSDLTSHVGDKSNPHGVTKAQVGLGNVDNTSDLNKPISTATQAALDLKANQATTYTKEEVDDLLEPKLNTTTASSTYATITNLNVHTTNKSNPHSVTKAQVGLGNVDNTSDLSKPISTATQAALDLKANQSTTYTKTEVDDLLEPKLDSTTASSTYATITNLNAHTSSTSNPHKVTKAQVGLGNVDNTSDANKPVSTAQQTALNLKADKSTTYTKTEVDDLLAPKLDTETAEDTYATISNLNTHTTNKSNPHSVTKAQVGLGNVDNTSDANKPVSTAQQAALDEKQNTLTQVQLNAVNSGITSAKVSTYDNYATEIAGKQSAGDYATNTALSQGLNGKVDKNQGVASAGKVLAVNEQGVVEPTEIKAGGVNATYDATNHRITFA